jgi:hypothetical protein
VPAAEVAVEPPVHGDEDLLEGFHLDTRCRVARDAGEQPLQRTSQTSPL